MVGRYHCVTLAGSSSEKYNIMIDWGTLGHTKEIGILAEAYITGYDPDHLDWILEPIGSRSALEPFLL